MIIDLFPIVSTKGCAKTYDLDIKDYEFSTINGSYKATRISPITLDIQNGDGKRIKFNLTGSMDFILPCDRCLTDVTITVNLNFEKEFALEKEKIVVEDLDEPEYIDGLNMDTDQLVYDEMLVNWPMKVLCKEDCRGICSKCGLNLNIKTCDCDRTVVDPRMAAIKDIFNKSKEV